MTPFDLLILLTAFLGVLTFGAWASDVIGRHSPLDETERERRR